MKKIIAILFFAVGAYALDDVSVPNTFVDSSVIEAADFNQNFDTLESRIGQLNDSLDTKFMRFADLEGGDSTLNRLQVDTIRSNPDVDSLKGLAVIRGNPDIDSIQGLAVLSGNPVIDSIQGMAIISGNPVIDSIQGLNVMRGNPDIDSISGSPYINLIKTDSIQLGGNSYITNYVKGTFACTLMIVGEDTAAGTASYIKLDSLCIVKFPDLSIASSSTNSPILYNIPSALNLSGGTTKYVPCVLKDNNAIVSGYVIVDSDATWSTGKMDLSSFTAALNKGFFAKTTLYYYKD